MIYLKVIVKGGHNMTYSEQMLDQLEAGKLKEAQNSFKLALINDDDDMLFSLAEELYALGFLQQARTIYLKLLDCYPDEDELKTNLATIAIDEGHNDEALSYLAQIKPDSPAYVQSLLVAADLYQTEEEFEVTEEKLKGAYALAPDEPAVEFALGEFYFMVGQYSEAIQYYFQLIKNGYTDFAKVDIAGRLGICYAQSGQFKKALGYFNQVKPEYQTSDIRFQKGLTRLQLGDTEKAIKTLEDLINDDNQYASAYPELAKAYEKENKYQQALRVVQEGLSVDQLADEQASAWAERWEKSDITIDGDEAAQQGIRFNLFQLFSTYYGNDARLNIGPKGFTGEKYGGATVTYPDKTTDTIKGSDLVRPATDAEKTYTRNVLKETKKYI